MRMDDPRSLPSLTEFLASSQFSLVHLAFHPFPTLKLQFYQCEQALDDAVFHISVFSEMYLIWEVMTLILWHM